MTTTVSSNFKTTENGFTFQASYNNSETIGDDFDFASSYLNINATNRTPGVVPEPPSYLVTSVTVLYILIFIIGILGNIMVVIVVGCSRNLRTTINIYIVNLCVADFLVFFVCLPPILVELHVKEIWYFGEIMCKDRTYKTLEMAWSHPQHDPLLAVQGCPKMDPQGKRNRGKTVPFLEVVVASASVFTIIAITIERFRVVYKPMSITNNNLTYAVKSVIFIWIAGIILSSPILFIVTYRDSRLKDGTPIKVCRMPAKYDWQKSYFVLVALFNYIIPCIIIAILYFFLCKKLVLRRNIALDSCDFHYREKRRLRKQVMQIIWTIVLVFFICHLPFRVVSMWWIFEDKMKIASLGLEINLVLLYYSRLFLFLNHAINPILYNFVSTKFRHSCFNLLFSNHRQNSSVRTQERKLQKIADSIKYSTPIINMKNGMNKENIRL
ncbi:hypothetical protein KUTeg_019260, partial [Tegillarca granosa]